MIRRIPLEFDLEFSRSTPDLEPVNSGESGCENEKKRSSFNYLIKEAKDRTASGVEVRTAGLQILYKKASFRRILRPYRQAPKLPVGRDALGALEF